MPVKTPNPDDVFDKWINKMRAKDLEKKFKVKGVPFSKTNISSSESVKEVQKFTAFYFQSEKKVTTPTTAEEKFTDVKGVGKVKFYDFTAAVDSETWKDKSKVPLFDTLKPDNCPKCKGTGYINCKKCKGDRLVPCKKCKGKGAVQCKDCDGTGSKEVQVNILKNGKEKIKKKIKYNCPTCFGTGKLECNVCGGTGKIPCPDCKANARYRCDKCKGVGHFYKYSLGFVPFKKTSAEIPHLFFRPDVEKELGYRLSNAISQVEGIRINNVNKLNESDVIAQLGYELDGNTKKLMQAARKSFENLQKSEMDKPHYPIYIFPILELDIVTPQNKKFKMFSIGSDMGYTVLDRGFK
ncbi:MAG: hypothetical protein HWN65_05370 [Candidatus Helarchaeota archaeon]|nr:hypothetical protein [Candidatus Helarchaeota archaeon]